MELPVLSRRAILPATGPVGQVALQTPTTGLNEVTRGLEAASQETLQAQQLDQAKSDRAQLSGLEAGLASWETQQIYDPNTGAMSKKNKDALGVREQYLPEFDKHAAELGKQIQSPRVKAAFDAITAERRNSIDRNLGQHVGQEKDAYENTQRTANMSAQDDLVAHNPTDPATISGAIERKRWVVNDAMDANGIPKDDPVRTAALSASDSAVHRQAITGLVNIGKYTEASNYFNANKSAMGAADIGAVDGVVREGMVRSESTRQSDSLVAKYGTEGALSHAKSIEDPDVRRATESQIRQQISDREALINIHEKQSTDAGWDILHGNDPSKPSGKTWQDIPPAIWKGIPGPTREAMMNANERKPMDAAGMQIYYDFRSRLANPLTRQEALKENLMVTAYPKLPPQETKQLMDLQSSVLSGDEKAKSVIDGVQSEDQIVTGALKGLGLGKSNPSQHQIDEGNLFKRKVDENVRALESVTKKQATTEDVQKIVDELTQKVVYDKGYLWDSTGYAFSTSITDIPPAEANAIAQKLQSRGLSADPDSVVRLYLANKAAQDRANKLKPQ